MNDLSSSLQGKNVNTLNCYEKLNALKTKLSLWCQRVKIGNYSNFASLEEIVDDSESSSFIPSVYEEILARLKVPSTGAD